MTAISPVKRDMASSISRRSCSLRAISFGTLVLISVSDDKAENSVKYFDAKPTRIDVHACTDCVSNVAGHGADFTLGG